MRRSSSLYASILPAALALAAAGCSAPADAPPALPLVQTMVMAAPVSAGERGFAGTVRSRIESDLGFRVDGKATERRVSAGEHVQRGQVLMRLDATDYGLAAKAASAELAAAEAQAKNAEADRVRLSALLEHGAVSRRDFERAEADARATAETVQAARAAANAAANRVAYSDLLADADGVVTDISVEAGQVVAAGRSVMRLAHDGPRDVEVALPEQFGSLAVGSHAVVTLLSGGEPITAHPRVIAGSADPVTRTYRARYALERDVFAPLGTTARVSFIETDAPPAFEAPLSAVYDAGGGPGVWVVDASASNVHWRPISIAGYGDETVRIESGVRAGERIVTLGAHLLSDGQSVRLAPVAENNRIAAN